MQTMLMLILLSPLILFVYFIFLHEINRRPINKGKRTYRIIEKKEGCFIQCRYNMGIFYEPPIWYYIKDYYDNIIEYSSKELAEEALYVQKKSCEERINEENKFKLKETPKRVYLIKRETKEMFDYKSTEFVLFVTKDYGFE